MAASLVANLPNVDLVKAGVQLRRIVPARQNGEFLMLGITSCVGQTSLRGAFKLATVPSP